MYSTPRVSWTKHLVIIQKLHCCLVWSDGAARTHAHTASHFLASIYLLTGICSQILHWSLKTAAVTSDGFSNRGCSCNSTLVCKALFRPNINMCLRWSDHRLDTHIDNTSTIRSETTFRCGCMWSHSFSSMNTNVTVLVHIEGPSTHTPATV